jgi:hypothetical protein
VLLPAALKPDLPTLGIRKADPVQRFELHSALLLEADPTPAEE